MKLRNKVSVIVLLLWVASVIIIYTGFHHFFLVSYLDLEKRDALENLARTKAIIEQNVQTLNRTIQDWAIWDDTYQFVVDKNEKYRKSNLDMTSLITADIDMLLLFDVNGHPIFMNMLNKNRTGTIPLPEQLLNYLTPTSNLVYQPKINSNLKGILSLPYGIYFIASRAIIKSNKNGPVHGTLIMGKYVSPAVLARIKEIANLSLTIHPTQGLLKSSPLLPILDTLTTTHSEVIERPNSKFLKVYDVLKDINDQVIAIIEINLPRNIYQIGFKTILYSDAILAVCTLLVLLVLRSLLQKFIVGRIENLNDELNQINTAHYTTQDFINKPKDEVSSVAALYYQATHDSLTGLANRNLLLQVFNQYIKRQTMTTQKIVILFFDIDLFKRINDTLGHKIGDDVLIHLAEILNKSLRPTDLAARLGGDEFVVMLTDMDEEAIKPTVDRLHKKIAKPTIIHGHQLSINTSMGVTIYPDDGSSIEELLKKADIALYEVKDNGRGHYLFYSTALSKALEDAHRKEKDLQRGYDEKEFCLYYQPIYDCQTKRIICLESLIRWQHPEKGLLHAGKIIPLAEKTGLINIIGEWSIRTACSQVKKWQNSGIPIVPVAVNLSYLQAQQSSLNELIFEILAETGLDPHLLVLELTETGYIQITPQIIAELHLLRDRGIQLSVDDFGTGYSGLRYLKSLPINKLKIDQSFIKDILVNPDDYAITLAIIAIANQLRLEIIAEGIESKEQFELLKMHRVNGAQGFYLCPPISAAECEKLLIQNAQEFERV